MLELQIAPSQYTQENTLSFEREDRYIVLKRTDVNKCLPTDLWLKLEEICDTVNYFRGLKGSIKCVVVEKDWPEYEVVWKLIEDRVNAGQNNSIQ